MKNPQGDSKTATIINGVVLTEGAIAFLESLQEGDNVYIKDTRDEINNAISQLILYTDHIYEKQAIEVLDTIKYLNTFNRKLKYLMKP